MTETPEALRSLVATELDETNYPAFRDRIRVVETEPVTHTPRSYDGYPRVDLPRPRARLLTSLDATLLERRSQRSLGHELPTKSELGRLLWLSHGATASEGRGPTPSAGKLCALELYVASFSDGWLPRAGYHYDRSQHTLARVAPSTGRSAWLADVPSLGQCEGGALLFLLVSDFARVEAKYGHRSTKLALLEAGHLMQNLCLVSASVGRAMLPLGGFFERNVARRLHLHDSDTIAYAGIFG